MQWQTINFSTVKRDESFNEKWKSLNLTVSILKKHLAEQGLKLNKDFKFQTNAPNENFVTVDFKDKDQALLISITWESIRDNYCQGRN